MPSFAERAAKLERRLKERNRVVRIEIAAWLKDVTAKAATQPPTPAPAQASQVPERCDVCAFVRPRGAKFCAGCGLAFEEVTQ